MKTNALQAVSTAVAKRGGKILLKCKAMSPELLLVGGIVVGVAGVVSACLATRKVDAAIKETQDDIDAVQALVDEEIKKAADHNGEVPEEVVKEIKRKYRRKFLQVYAKGGRRLLRIYIWAFLLIVLAISMALGSHGILKTRYLRTVAAYTALDESFRDYRQRIRDIAGDEAEKRFYDGLEEIEIEKQDENGNTVKETAYIQTKPKKDSPYEFDFNVYTTLEATRDLGHNFTYLRAQQCTANDLLNAKGFVTLYEVLGMLGLKQTDDSLVLGWVKHSKNGDGYIDFGFSDSYEEYTNDFRSVDRVPNIHMNMNCDGQIYGFIEEACNEA